MRIAPIVLAAWLAGCAGDDDKAPSRFVGTWVRGAETAVEEARLDRDRVLKAMREHFDDDHRMAEAFVMPLDEFVNGFRATLELNAGGAASLEFSFATNDVRWESELRWREVGERLELSGAEGSALYDLRGATLTRSDGRRDHSLPWKFERDPGE